MDSFMMETVCSASAAAYLAVGAPELEIAAVGVFALVTTWRAATFSGHGNLLWPCVAAMGGYVYSTLRLGGCGLLWRYVGGVSGLCLGLVCKMCDTTGRRAWGTAAFHYAVGAGSVLLWSWAQSLPLAS